MIKKLLAVSFIIASCNCFGQQQPVLSQYMLNNYYFNPACTGYGELYNFSFLHRSQWSGYQDYRGNTGAPETQLFTATANFDSTGHTIGLLASRDNAGYLTTYQVQLSYAYRIQLTQKSTLALGIRGGIGTKSIEYGRYIVKHPDDDRIPEGKQSETQPEIILGLWLNHEKYYLAVSAMGIVAETNYNTLGIENERSIVATAGYRFSTRDWTVTPSVQMITNINQLSMQEGILFDYTNTFWTGLSYRHEDAACLIAGFGMFNKILRFSYAFDYTTGNQSSKTSTSHELMMSFHFGRLHGRKAKDKVVK